jgi:cobalamin biosynthesis protein CobD/CbiB
MATTNSSYQRGTLSGRTSAFRAAMAGALCIRLAGPIRYEGVLYDKP